MPRDETVWRWTSRAVGRWPTGLLASVAMVAAVTGLINVVEPLVPAVARPPASVNLLVLYTPVVVAAAMLRGFWLAAGTALVSVLAFDFFFGAPLHTVGIDDVRARVTLVTFLATAVVVGVPAVRLRRALRELAHLSEQLARSRARIVAAGDEARRRIERDLHDGAQQRLISLALQLRVAQAAVPPEAGELAARLDSLVNEATSTLDELRELARGIHPVVLAEGGLAAALEVLARRSAVPVELDVRVDRRPPEPIETAAYYLVAEAVTNAAKHAHASAVTVTVEADAADAVLRVAVRDDGCGGAHLGGGSGLVGLKDRVEALGGRIVVDSPRGAGTDLRVELPLSADGRSAISLSAVNGGVTSR